MLRQAIYRKKSRQNSPLIPSVSTERRVPVPFLRRLK